ncbi:MAG: 4Fe-4S binding protein [Deltaproteobacteria bacterium]|jgi:NADH-quinone oxidoreductase subunit I|nr:4Fe-4S binding protein [Deltaproteobacteria bacterium]
MLKEIWDNLKGLYSLGVGMAITGRYLLSPVETIHYPRQVVADEIMESFRGPIQLTFGPKDPAQSRCISCQMCVKACPGHCLTVTKGETKSPVVWLYDFSYCCLCGACVETCPASALEFSHKVYLVAKSRAELSMDLLADLKSRALKKAESVKSELPGSAPTTQNLAAPGPKDSPVKAEATKTPLANSDPEPKAPTEARPPKKAAKADPLPSDATIESRPKNGSDQ